MCMSEELVTVAVFGAPYEAGMAKSELEAYGIPAFIADEFTIGANPFYSYALGGIKLQVPTSYVEEARQLLSVEMPLEGANDLSTKSVKNTAKTMAKSFVWIYLAFAAVMAVFTVYVCLR